MSISPAYRGQPLVAFVLLIGGWVAVRAMVLDASSARLPAAVGRALVGQAPAAAPPPPSPMSHRPAEAPADRNSVRLLRRSSETMPPRPGLGATQFGPIAPQSSPPGPTELTLDRKPARPAAPSRLTPSVLLAQGAPPAAPTARPAAGEARWSADGWLLLRRGGAVSPGAGFVPPTYGASQAGAVLRYRLMPGSAHRPAIYLRGSAALNGSREREAALGLSGRPIAGLPLVVAAEARVNGQPSATRVRPAVFAYTELPAVGLPLGARAEAYGQAGYVGGDFATAFADGQLRVDRRVLRLDRGELRLGGGTWGGAQKGASRLDIGPTATIALPMGGSAAARLGFDWRFRIAGNASPSSGPALTLSAGF